MESSRKEFESDPLVIRAREDMLLKMLYQAHSVNTRSVHTFINPFDVQGTAAFAKTHENEFYTLVVPKAWQQLKETKEHSMRIGTVHINPFFWASVFYSALLKGEEPKEKEDAQKEEKKDDQKDEKGKEEKDEKEETKKMRSILVSNGCCNRISHCGISKFYELLAAEWNSLLV
jgi:hypothetical protein